MEFGLQDYTALKGILRARDVFPGSLGVAVIRYTDCADLTDTRGFSLKKSVFVRVIRRIRVQMVFNHGNSQ
jgi:hypothetical protein